MDLSKYIILLILSISFYSEGVLSKITSVYSLPVFTFIAFPAILFLLFYIKLSQRLIVFLFFLVSYLFLVSSIHLFLNNFSFFNLFLRLLASLFLAIVVFLFLCYIVRKLNSTELNFFIISGFILVFILSIYEFLKYKTRVTGYSLFSEPSHLGYYLTMIFITFLFLKKEELKPWLFYSLITISLINLFMTFSTTALYSLFLMMTALAIITISFKALIRFLIFSIVLILLVYILFFSLFPENYLNAMVNITVYGLLYDREVLFTEVYSFSDRYQFFFIFPNMINNITDVKDLLYFLFGNGLGSEEIYFNRIFPEYLSFIPTIKGGSYLTSLQSKLLVYGGFILFMIINTLWLKVVINMRRKNKILSATFLGIFFNSFSMLGALGLPIIWFWAAYIYNFMAKNDYNN